MLEAGAMFAPAVTKTTFSQKLTFFMFSSRGMFPDHAVAESVPAPGWHILLPPSATGRASADGDRGVPPEKQRKRAQSRLPRVSLPQECPGGFMAGGGSGNLPLYGLRQFSSKVFGTGPHGVLSRSLSISLSLSL